MKKYTVILIAIFLITSYVVIADEPDGDYEPTDDWPNAKMHFPQEPDPNGWDVNMSMVIGDDWECNETGEITDITFWISWAYDNVGEIPWLDVSIWDNVPEFVDAEYSHPGTEIWGQTFSSSEFTVTLDGTGDQGFCWYPDFGGFEASNHNNYYRVDINDITNPFNQTSGTIYWLVIETPQIYNQTNCPGWKTTTTIFMDSSVRQMPIEPYWEPIQIGEEQFYDLAFVIQGNESETSIYNEFYVNTTYDATTPGWGTTHFDTIQDAVDACVNFYNYTIYVDPGTYNENVVVDENSFDSLTIYGNETGTRAQVYGQSGTLSTWEILDDNVVLDGFYIENPGATTYHGVFLDSITNVNVSDCFVNQSPANGIYSVGCSNINIYDCLIDSAGGSGVYLSNSDNVSVYENYIIDSSSNNIFSSSSEFCTVYENEITRASSYGIRLNQCNDHLIYHNNLYLNSMANANVVGTSTNYWDNGYPMGGNYWDDHGSQDIYSGPNQDVSGSDGICDSTSPDPNNIATNNVDNYPFLNPYNGTYPTWNFAPEISNEDPSDGASDIDTNYSEVSVDVTDAEGDSFNVSIHGDYVNDQNYNTVTNGTFNATLTSMPYWTTITWYVNVSYLGGWVNETFTFETKKPSINVQPPSPFTVDTYNSTRLDLYWEKGTNASHTYIRYDTGDYPTNRSDGNPVANYTWDGVGIFEGLTPLTTYYFKAWGYNDTYNIWSTSNVTAMNTTGAPEVVWVDDDGPVDSTHFNDIANAIDNVSINGTINILNGTYSNTPYLVDKPVRIIGEDSDLVTIDGRGLNAFDLGADLILFKNLTITNSSNGISGIDRNMCGVVGCTFTNNDVGVYFKNFTKGAITNYLNVDEPPLYFVGDSNEFLDNDAGVLMENTSEVEVTNNSFIDQTSNAIEILVGSENYIMGNSIVNSSAQYSSSINFNTVDNSSIEYNQILTGRGSGISLTGCIDLYISNNNLDEISTLIGGSCINITSSTYIYVEFNNLSGFDSVAYSAIGMYSSSHCYFFYNNIFDDNYISGAPAWDTNSANTWCDVTMGNWWEMYDEEAEGAYDNDTNGIADDPFPIAGGTSQDVYPVINQLTPTPNTLYVDDDYDSLIPGWNYTAFDNIQSAIERVSVGGEIYVHNGSYSGVHITKTLDLSAVSPLQATIDGGIDLDADNSYISGFIFENGGIDVSNYDDNTFYQNQFESTMRDAISLMSGSQNNIGYMNNFYSSVSDEGNNQWDNGYPLGGNYWNFTGDDYYNGVSQNILGPDGFIDTNYTFGLLNSVDEYPLTRPWNETNIEPTIDTGTPNSSYIDTSPTFTIEVSDGNNDAILVEVYWSNHSLIFENVTYDTTTYDLTSILSHDTTYNWYVNVSDGFGGQDTVSFSFTTCKQFDLIPDGVVDYLDVSALVSHYNEIVSPPGSEPSDINSDGIVNYLDVSMLVANYGFSY